MCFKYKKNSIKFQERMRYRNLIDFGPLAAATRKPEFQYSSTTTVAARRRRRHRVESIITHPVKLVTAQLRICRRQEQTDRNNLQVVAYRRARSFTRALLQTQRELFFNWLYFLDHL